MISLVDREFVLTLPKSRIPKTMRRRCCLLYLIMVRSVDDLVAIVRISRQNVRGLFAYQRITFPFPAEGVQ